MPDPVFIPQKTADKLNSEHPKGTRHQAAIEMAMPLIGNGLPPAAVFATLRAKFDADVPDSEIEGVIRWCQSRNPTPSGYDQPFRRSAPAAPPKPNRTPQQQCEWWLGGKTMTPEKLGEASKLKVSTDPRQAAYDFLETLYKTDQRLNIVCKFLQTDGRASPHGGGRISTVREWCDYIRAEGIPRSDAGAWVRMNPVAEKGSGKDGAVTDADVVAWKFLLLESDDLPIEVQLALYANLKLPIGGVILSGGKSAHAWARLDCGSADRYTTVAKRVLAALAPFGIDQSNKNPSRLSRFPGAKRVIGAAGEGIQQLLYLNPGEGEITDKDLDDFESSLLAPFPEEQPLRRHMLEAIDRYDELYANRGKLGVQVGFRDFDRDTGGFKAGQMTAIAAGTNGGKSTMAMNMINGAISNGHGVVLFTLEMGADEIVDLLISINCEVSRNAFNTGFFSNDDQVRMAGKTAALCKFPLWIYDDATLSVEQIGARIKSLTGKIALAVVDYVQIITPSDARLPREQQVAEFARGLRILCKETKLPFLVLSQLNDDGKLRESRVIAHEAHNVIVLEQEGESMLMKVIKGRRIMKKDYRLRYLPSFGLIEDEPMPSPAHP